MLASVSQNKFKIEWIVIYNVIREIEIKHIIFILTLSELEPKGTKSMASSVSNHGRCLYHKVFVYYLFSVINGVMQMIPSLIMGFIVFLKNFS